MIMINVTQKSFIFAYQSKNFFTLKKKKDTKYRVNYNIRN